MSLILPAPRPFPARPLVLLALTFGLTLVSAFGLAPTLAKALPHAAVCHCAHCPGGLKCCCLGKGACPIP